MRLDRTFGRFLVNGLFAAAVHFAALVALVDVAQLKYASVANGFAALFGIGASYVGNKLLVFRSEATHARTLPRFLFVYALVALLHAGVLAVWTDYYRLPYMLGFLIATSGSVLLTYTLNRKLVFNSAIKDGVN
jgi:putative flippase GtrA